MNEYFENKKRQGLIFTLHNIYPRLPYISMKPGDRAQPIDMPAGPSWWSRLSGRFRTAEEQREYVASGCIDRALPPLHDDAAEKSEETDAAPKDAAAT